MPRSLTYGSLILLCLGRTAVVAGEDFRMQTEVFHGKQKVGQTLTLFTQDLVYDFVQDKNNKTLQTTIFDWRRKRIVLLDVPRQLKTTITTGQLMEVLDFLGRRVPHPTEDDFQVETPSKERVVVRGRMLSYEVLGSPPRHAFAAAEYQRFADWYSRLNATRTRNPPPYARIRLNSAVASKGLLPTQVTRSKRGSRKTVRSKHSTLWILSNTDRERIQKAGTQLVEFRIVTPDQFWRPEVAARGTE